MPAGPVFVAGCPRSGTSALSWAIASHPGYWTSAETHYFYYLLRNDAETIRQAYDLSSGPGQWLDKHGIEFRQFLAYLGIGFDRMMRSQSGGHHWIDGSPENALIANPLLDMFPTAHMFLVVRDPRSVCFSMLSSGFAPKWATDLDEAILTWKHYARAVDAAAAALPDRVLEIRQEEMRREPAAVAARIADRLDLAAPGVIATFLGTQTVNSSFDHNSYATGSPFRAPSKDPALTRDGFLSKHGAYIMREVGDLATRHGYH